MVFILNTLLFRFSIIGIMFNYSNYLSVKTSSRHKKKDKTKLPIHEYFSVLSFSVIFFTLVL